MTSAWCLQVSLETYTINPEESGFVDILLSGLPRLSDGRSNA